MKSLTLFAAFLVSGAAAASTGSDAKYSDIQAELRGLAEQYPATAELFDLAVSDSGLMIQGVKLGHGPVNHLLVATHHGNEYGSTEVARAFAASVAAAPLAGETVYVIPVLNITGYDRRARGEPTADASYDPNRDYPGPCGTAGPFKLKSTAALAAFLDQRQIVAAATLHTFHPAVVYPWGFGTPDLTPPFLDVFKMLVNAATVESRYATGNSTEVIYPAPGTFEDYSFWRHGIWSILFELGSSHSPHGDALEEMKQVNVAGLRRMFAQAPYTRASEHEFRGKCDLLMSARDRHDE